MAEDTREVKRTEKIRGQDITGKVMVLAKTHPQQLILFQTFLPEEDPDDQYSNTIELYDAIQYLRQTGNEVGARQSTAK